MIGLPATGTIGFGRLQVSGRNRVPKPPAITTAFTIRSSFEPGANLKGYGLETSDREELLSTDRSELIYDRATSSSIFIRRLAPVTEWPPVRNRSPHGIPPGTIRCRLHANPEHIISVRTVQDTAGGVLIVWSLVFEVGSGVGYRDLFLRIVL
jgi:hypothetical protein